jgi:hypothetical protein
MTVRTTDPARVRRHPRRSHARRAALAVGLALATASVSLGAAGAGASLASTRETVFAGSGFGRAVSVYGDLVVTGASDGVAVFRRDVSGWTHDVTLRPTDVQPGDRFGAAVDIQGSFLAVGAPDATVDGKPGAGAVYVFVRFPEGNWFQYPRLVSPAPTAGAHFGAAVDTSGETEVVVGSPGAGTATVFVRFPDPTGPGTWIPTTVLAPPGAGGPAAVAMGFGSSVAISSDLLWVGAPKAPDPAGPGAPLTGAGAVFAFRANGLAWSFDARLVDDPAVAGAHFGQALAKEAGVVLVGSPGTRSLVGFEAGAPGAYSVIGRDRGGPGFGTALGAGPGEAGAGDPSVRAAYLYGSGPTGGVLLGTLVPSSGPRTDAFGASIDTAASVVVVGAPGNATIHIFDVVPTAAQDRAAVWILGARPYAAAGDVFGNFTVTRAGARVTDVTGAGRVAIAVDHAPFLGIDLHPFGSSGLLAGEIRVRDDVTGVLRTFLALSGARATGPTSVAGTALALELGPGPHGLGLIAWAVDDRDGLTG